jgi:2-phospho-L-lactate guanylyltransferase
MTAMSHGARTDRRIWAAVAYKGTVGVKQRLAGLLDESERIALGLAMLDDVMLALHSVTAVERILLMTQASDLAARWMDPHLAVIADGGEDGVAVGRLNAAFTQAQAIARLEGVEALLLLPADLPLLSGGAVDALIGVLQSPGVVLAPDRGNGGTNALLVSPPDALAPSFGDGSFNRHLRAAKSAGLSVRVIEAAGLALDIDTPPDIAALLDSGGESRARHLLLQLGIARRLERPANVRALPQSRSATI